jgi:hypothetical protein
MWRSELFRQIATIPVMTNPLLETASLAEFNSLINELIQGGPSRSVFKRWELDLLLDFGNCRIRQSSRSDVLRRYQRAVQKQFLRGEYDVQPLSIFLAEERADGPVHRRARTPLCRLKKLSNLRHRLEKRPDPWSFRPETLKNNWPESTEPYGILKVRSEDTFQNARTRTAAHGLLREAEEGVARTGRSAI